MSNAFFLGLLGASSLFIGALLGVFWKPSRLISAAIMAFGSGTLLSALAFDITLPSYHGSGVWPVLTGFLAGGTLFNLLTRYVDRLGGFLRKPASRRRFLFQRRQAETSAILEEIAHVEVIQRIPPSEAQAVVPLLRPMHANPDDVLFREGDIGDWFGMIVKGEVDICKNGKAISKLGPGEVFGEMALLTGERRSAGVVARSPLELYRLNREHFDDLMTRSPHLARALSRVLAKRLQSTTDIRIRAERDLEAWRRMALDSVEIDLSPAEEQQMLQSLVKDAAPLAIWVGTLIDNVPEAIAIGMSAHLSINHSFLLAVFLANLPEALSSARGMKESGTSVRQILSLWGGQVILCGLCAVGGSILQMHSSPTVLSLAQGVSGGAILAMVASTMMPEAYELGGGSVSFSTILGFLTGFLLAVPEL
ncbi:MAG: cyclic nucleotide-binding domain-containing protein [Cyanobacteria bacterium P01_F01_bin.33]